MCPAPPKCLDEEDVEYFTQVDERHKQFLNNQKQLDEKQLEEFRQKSLQAAHSSGQQPSLLKMHQKKEEESKKSPAIGR